MGRRVLVVDDDPGVRLFNVTAVEQVGHTAVEAGNGEEALKLVQQEIPDLIILDVLMPRQSGIKFYRQLRTDPEYARIPVIMLSGIARRSFLKSQQALAEFGGGGIPEPDAYLEKPVKPAELEACIAQMLSA